MLLLIFRREKERDGGGGIDRLPPAGTLTREQAHNILGVRGDAPIN